MLDKFRSQLITHRPLALDLVAKVGLEKFCERYAIDVKEADGLVSLKYSPTSNMDDPAVRQCRGLVVYKDDPVWPVCYPYDKFFNMEEPRASSEYFNWSTARYLEKLDGSLMLFYFDWRLGTWRVASSGHPTAGGPYGTPGQLLETFSHAFWSTWSSLGYAKPDEPITPMDDIWYFFELCRPDNRIVVKYDRPRLVLHGARRRVGLMELSFPELEAHAKKFRWELVGSHRVGGGNIRYARESVSKWVDVLDPLKLEGLVVVNDNFHRMKVKNPRYVEIHHLRGSRSPRAVVELWKAGEVEEVLAHFPELHEQFDPITDGINSAVYQLEAAWITNCDAPSRKEFALAVKHMPFSSVLFFLFDMDKKGEIPPYEGLRPMILSFIRSMKTNAILNALDAMDPGG